MLIVTQKIPTYSLAITVAMKFTMYGYQAGWKYHTETIDEEATAEEIEDLQD